MWSDPKIRGLGKNKQMLENQCKDQTIWHQAPGEVLLKKVQGDYIQYIQLTLQEGMRKEQARKKIKAGNWKSS